MNEKAALHIAVDNGNIDIVKLLLDCDKLDVNIIYIIKYNIFDKIKNHFI